MSQHLLVAVVIVTACYVLINDAEAKSSNSRKRKAVMESNEIEMKKNDDEASTEPLARKPRSDTVREIARQAQNLLDSIQSRGEVSDEMNEAQHEVEHYMRFPDDDDQGIKRENVNELIKKFKKHSLETVNKTGK